MSLSAFILVLLVVSVCRADTDCTPRSAENSLKVQALEWQHQLAEAQNWLEDVLPLYADPGRIQRVGDAPEQVHLTLAGGPDRMAVRWITLGNVSSVVEYGTSSQK
eukprot:TRINITY_DN20754_c0_g1_i1.p1 TRINITY_DN20754_c0_g1~~TRINITY_DN20754_c0_g1_i1.p1  ORF type:complete len:106 (-),score=20.82 TRINITY_DN20754_c0_g1_i1:123-440(-)